MEKVPIIAPARQLNEGQHAAKSDDSGGPMNEKGEFETDSDDSEGPMNEKGGMETDEYFFFSKTPKLFFRWACKTPFGGENGPQRP